MPNDPNAVPEGILQNIAQGRAVLFLGAGASYGCKSSDGKQTAPTGTDLAGHIADRFLSARRRNDALAKVADLAVSQHSLLDVQIFVKSLLEELEPQEFHQIIPAFKWKAIVTTNYDCIIEKAYSKAKKRLQNLVPIIANGDLRLLESSNNPVPLIKIHGCITRATDTALPLVLANEQYAKYENGRERLVTQFRELGKDHPIIFCGYNIGDPHISQILYSLEAGFRDRPLYFAANPALDDLDTDYWANYKMGVSAATFSEFLAQIDTKISAARRALGSVLTNSSGSLSPWIKVGQTLGNSLKAVLSNRLFHVFRAMPTENPRPEKFYRGDSTAWSSISSQLDFSRAITNQVLSATDLNTSSGPKFMLIKGHAGSGKSVVLKRIAWELCGAENAALTFFSETTLSGVKDVLDELCTATGERVFIVVDDALLDAQNLNDCLAHAKKRALPVTFIAGARGNEWNVSQHSAHLTPDEEYTLGDLSRPEATSLVRLLKEHNCLGVLAKLEEDAQVKSLLQENERQLLVALHIATLGDNDFRRLLRSEYRNVLPEEARILYLDVCSLHRLQVPVRAGLISRMSGTNFHIFQEKFFLPLEKLVSVFSDPLSRDFAYRARHSEIARIVFEEALPTPEARANQLARILGALNTDYSSDDRAATLILKGRFLADEFSDRSLVERIFQAAEQSGIERAFVLQQRAIFETTHPGGSSSRALRLVDEALSLNSRSSSSIHHTKALILRNMARAAEVDTVLADRYREQALTELREHGQLRSSKYSIGTYCELLLDQIRSRLTVLDLSEMEALSQEVVVRKLSDLENHLAEASQRDPDDTHISTLRAELFSLLDKHPRAVAVLKVAFTKSPANAPVALRLARQLIDSGEEINIAEALSVLRKAVSLNASSKPLNYQLAKLLMSIDEQENRAEISKLLRRSFTPGDTHFDAQFWCARHEFLYGDRTSAKGIYEGFSKRPVPYVDGSEKRGLVKNSIGKPSEFHGSIRHIKGDFGFVNCSELNDSVFLHRNQLKSGWSSARIGDRIQFKLAFTFRGPCCVDASKE